MMRITGYRHGTLPAPPLVYTRCAQCRHAFLCLRTCDSSKCLWPPLHSRTHDLGPPVRTCTLPHHRPAALGTPVPYRTAAASSGLDRERTARASVNTDGWRQRRASQPRLTQTLHHRIGLLLRRVTLVEPLMEPRPVMPPAQPLFLLVEKAEHLKIRAVDRVGGSHTGVDGCVHLGRSKGRCR